MFLYETWSMKIILDYPPNIEEIRKVFTFTRRVIFAYDGNIYNPDRMPLTTPIVEHEKIHFEQQRRIGNDEWWRLYLADPEFRVTQEIPAYRAQYRCAAPMIKKKDPHMGAHLCLEYAKKLAEALSGDTYGHCISFDEALSFITS